MTATELAKAVGVTSAAVSRWESQKMAPARTSVVRMSLALRFPLGFFYGGPLEAIPVDLPTFRARRSMTAKVRDGACADGEFAINLLMPFFRQRFELPKPALPVVAGEMEDSSPAAVATFLRHFWNMGSGPINNMIHLVEAKGVTVFWLSQNEDKVDAFSLWFDEHPYIFLNDGPVDGERERFTVAHELGHLMLHKNEAYATRYGPNWSHNEQQANEFASSFLMPYTEFRAECPRYPVLSEFIPLKHRWKVSIQAMIRRGRDVGRLTEAQYQSAYIEISRRQWRRAEPDPLPRERSQLHEILFTRLVSKGISVQALANELLVRPGDIGAVCPYARELLTSDSVVPARSDDESSEGRVLPFRFAR